MSSKVRVWQSCLDGTWSDWEMECADHPGERTTSTDWSWAMEAAWGHIAMRHGSHR